jgi:hypothetical protein
MLLLDQSRYAFQQANHLGAPAPATKAHMKQALFAIAIGILAGLVFGMYF